MDLILVIAVWLLYGDAAVPSPLHRFAVVAEPADSREPSVTATELVRRCIKLSGAPPISDCARFPGSDD